MRVTFQKVAVKGTRRWKDEEGTKRQQTREFYQTVSPFNLDADGKPKSVEQILEEIHAERDRWLHETPVR